MGTRKSCRIQRTIEIRFYRNYYRELDNNVKNSLLR